MKRKTILVVAGLAALGLAGGHWLATSRGAVDPTEGARSARAGRGGDGAAAAVVTAMAERADMPVRKRAIGFVETPASVVVKSRIDSQIEAGQASLQQAQAQEVSAQAGVTRTVADFERASSLAAKSYGSQATLDAATAARDQAKASLGSAVAGVAAAQANVEVLKAQRVEAARQVEELKIAEQKAERDLSFTRVTAPISGLVANTNVQLGDLVSAGKRLMSIVPLDQVYVDANFKETQVGPLKIGDRASITVDALPGQVFEGRVSGISGGTGSVFTLLPPDNATGNFTKIVQRVPVRIALAPEATARHVLRPGMSVVVKIDPRPSGQR